MTHKEFYIWLEGFMTNRLWVDIKQIDIETIQEKMKEVKDEPKIGIAEPYRVPMPINPFLWMTLFINLMKYIAKTKHN
jgi:hypothetical protein